MKKNLAQYLPLFNLNWLCVCGLQLLIIFSLAGCLPNKTTSWREEVKLSNDQIITAECSIESEHVYNGNNIGWLFLRERIKAVLPPSGRVVMWEGSLAPLAIDVAKDGGIYLVATAQSVRGQLEYSTDFYVAFKYNKDGFWARIPIDTVPLEIKPNMLLALPDDFSKNDSKLQVINLKTKEELNSDPRLAQAYKGWAHK
ncbi:hypothetical protein [Sapientia aquatica]|nr:hypothetical protein [Sapientia aquatica]